MGLDNDRRSSPRGAAAPERRAAADAIAQQDDDQDRRRAVRGAVDQRQYTAQWFILQAPDRVSKNGNSRFAE